MKRALMVIAVAAAATCACQQEAPERGDIAPQRAGLAVIQVPVLAGLEAGGGTQLRRREQYLVGVLARNPSDRDLAAAFGVLGKAYQAYGFPESAVAPYRNAWKLDPADFRWPYYLARALGQLHRDEEAVSAAGGALQLRPNDLPTLIFLGDTHLDLRHPEVAGKLFDRALGISESSAPALYGRGRVAMINKDTVKAIEYFEAALEALPQANSIHYALALAYRDSGDQEKAEMHMALRGELMPAANDPLMDELVLSNSHAVARRGVDALRTNQPQVALEWLEKARKLRPDDAEILLNLGAALGRLGRLPEALPHYRKAVSLQPHNARTHYNLGTTLAGLGEDDEALAELRRAVELSSDHPQAHYNLAQLLRSLDRDEDAREHVAHVLRIDPRHRKARILRARLLAGQGDCETAIEVVVQSLRLFPDDPELSFVLSRLLAACGEEPVDAPQALKLVQDLFSESPTAEHAVALALAHAARGEYRRAVDWQQRAIDLLPEGTPAEVKRILQDGLRTYESNKKGSVD